MNAGSRATTPIPTRRRSTDDTYEALDALYRHDGPFLSYYAHHDEVSGDDAPPALARFRQRLDEAKSAGATDLAIQAVESSLAPDVGPDVGGQGVLAAADGTSCQTTAHEGPAADACFIDHLPYAAPFLEWDQWRVPHAAVAVAEDIIEEVLFEPGAEPTVRPVGDTVASAAVELASSARLRGLELVVLGGNTGRARELAGALSGTLPAACDLTVLDGVDPGEFGDEVVTSVADKVARRTVSLLQEFRFLLPHDGAAQGVEQVVESLARGAADVLLVHDDPRDDRRLWFGSAGRDLSTTESATCPQSGRLVDVLIRSAVLQDMGVRIIPSTGERGPDADVGVLLRDPTLQVPDPDPGSPA